MGVVPADAASADGEADVLVVGYGPVGQALSILLAQHGWQVTAVEKYLTPFERPRAICFDRHAGRILGATGIADATVGIGEPIQDFIVVNGAGTPLMRARLGADERHRWPDTTSIYQPGLEAALADRGAELPNLRLLRGQEAIGLTDHGDRVEVTVRDAVTGASRTLSALWAVGCDGANSFVRDRIGATLIDGGFAADWMACDVVAHDPGRFPPSNTQVADPARPRADLSAGPGHRRWEFMRLPDEPLETFDTRENAWAMLAHFGVDPTNATLERHATYTCLARMADTWRSGRVLIAGDAAHQMPPFAGQGMCAGLRDAANLAWKLDLVLSGAAGVGLLDSYPVERRPDVQRAIDISVQLGEIIGTADAQWAARRDEVMIGILAELAGQPPPDPDDLAQPSDEALADGFFDRTGQRARGAAWLAPQARTGRTVDEVGRNHSADLCGHRFVLLSLVDPAGLLEAEQAERLGKLGVRLVHLVAPTATGVVTGVDALLDVDGTYTSWLTDTVGATAVLVRPDFHVYGAARNREELTAMVGGLLDRLG